VLILGGTRDALELAAALVARDGTFARARIVSSLAGRTAAPLLPPGETRIGGFGGADGLVTYLRREAIDAVVDATHPFAARISENAVVACARAGVPLITLDRPAPLQQAGDRWYRVPGVASAAARARGLGARIFLTIGRQELAPFAAIADRWFLIRAIDAPLVALPPHHAVVLARGPFAYRAELALLRTHAIDVVVAKESGGAATEAKLTAARTLGIPVVTIVRPPPSGARTVPDVASAIAWLETACRRPVGAR